MQSLTEIFYNIIEALLITGFISAYFDKKKNLGKKECIVSFAVIVVANTLTTILSFSWLITFFIIIFVVFGILLVFYKGSVLEKLLISVVTGSLIVLINILSFTVMSKVFNTEYQRLVNESNIMRFWTVMITKVVFLIAVSLIAALKRKKLLLLNKAEYTIISATLLVSGILVTIVRNMIYDSEKNYSAFLIIVFCLLALIIGQFYTMLYISKKNIAEQKMSVMKKQLEMQEDNIRILEKNHEATSKLRHDMNNYILCALEMAENAEYDELIKYLKNLSKSQTGIKKYYVHTDRKAIGAVINTKFAAAEENGIETRCVISDEMNNVEDIDAAILLANLLDNAVEACMKNKSDSSIKLKIWSNAGYYCIEIVNTVESDILASNPELVTCKRDKSLHGIGLQSVRDIVEKYDGMISFVQKNADFHVCISLSRDRK